MTLVRTTSTQLLARVLDQPELPARIQALEPAALGKLIDLVGLEDAGEIVAFATTEQLAHVFDEDLWRNEEPGEEERFDAERFALWLEIMLEAGDAFVAQRLAELPEELVTLAFHRHLLVLSLDDLRTTLDALEKEEADITEKALSDCLSEELDAYQLVAKSHDAWEAVLGAVLALDRDHRPLLERILDRCQQMSSDRIDDAGGLYEVLTAAEMLESDVAADREDRRAEAGYVAPRAAKAFLELARRDASDERDPITRAYFRDLKPVTKPLATATPLTTLIDEIEVAPAMRLGMGMAAVPPLLTRTLPTLPPAELAARSEELAYLANVLLAAGVFGGRKLRPVEAARAAIAIVNYGLEGAGGAALRSTPADVLFRRAYALVAPRATNPLDFRDITEILNGPI